MPLHPDKIVGATRAIQTRPKRPRPSSEQAAIATSHGRQNRLLHANENASFMRTTPPGKSQLRGGTNPRASFNRTPAPVKTPGTPSAPVKPRQNGLIESLAFALHDKNRQSYLDRLARPEPPPSRPQPTPGVGMRSRSPVFEGANAGKSPQLVEVEQILLARGR